MIPPLKRVFHDAIERIGSVRLKDLAARCPTIGSTSMLAALADLKRPHRVHPAHAREVVRYLRKTGTDLLAEADALEREIAETERQNAA